MGACLRSVSTLKSIAGCTLNKPEKQPSSALSPRQQGPTRIYLSREQGQLTKARVLPLSSFAPPLQVSHHRSIWRRPRSTCHAWWVECERSSLPVLDSAPLGARVLALSGASVFRVAMEGSRTPSSREELELSIVEGQQEELTPLNSLQIQPCSTQDPSPAQVRT